VKILQSGNSAYDNLQDDGVVRRMLPRDVDPHVRQCPQQLAVEFSNCSRLHDRLALPPGRSMLVDAAVVPRFAYRASFSTRAGSQRLASTSVVEALWLATLD
jgi:hypothetical protein